MKEGEAAGPLPPTNSEGYPCQKQAWGVYANYTPRLPKRRPQAEARPCHPCLPQAFCAPHPGEARRRKIALNRLCYETQHTLLNTGESCCKENQSSDVSSGQPGPEGLSLIMLPQCTAGVSAGPTPPNITLGAEES